MRQCWCHPWPRRARELTNGPSDIHASRHNREGVPQTWFVRSRPTNLGSVLGSKCLSGRDKSVRLGHWVAEKVTAELEYRRVLPQDVRACGRSAPPLRPHMDHVNTDKRSDMKNYRPTRPQHRSRSHDDAHSAE